MLAPSEGDNHYSTSIPEEEHSKDIPTVPSSNPPLRQNFIFDVPEASVPAVEIC